MHKKIDRDRSIDSLIDRQIEIYRYTVGQIDRQIDSWMDRYIEIYTQKTLDIKIYRDRQIDSWMDRYIEIYRRRELIKSDTSIYRRHWI